MARFDNIDDALFLAASLGSNRVPDLFCIHSCHKKIDVEFNIVIVYTYVIILAIKYTEISFHPSFI